MLKRVTWDIEGGGRGITSGSKVVPERDVDSQRASIRARAAFGATVTIKVTRV